MAIQTIGGAAASTGVQGTPILQIQKATASDAGIYFSETERYVEVTLSTPLPAGNYFFGLTRNNGNGTQVIITLDNGTILGAITATSAQTSEVQASFSVPVGRTVTKITFRRPNTYSWDSLIKLSAVVSTDLTNFYGTGKGSADTPKFNFPALPAGYEQVSNRMVLGNLFVTKDGSKTYFMAMVSTRANMNANTSDPFPAYQSETVNSNLKFYEYNLVSQTLTEKAAPAVFGALQVNVGWTSTAQPTSPVSRALSHFNRSFCAVSNSYVYFIPGECTLSAYSTSSGSYSGAWFYGTTGRYEISSNTWTSITSPWGYTQGWTQHGTAIVGDTLVLGAYYYRSGYSSADTRHFWQSSTTYADSSFYYYKPASGWGSIGTGMSTSSAGFLAAGRSFPANDRYVLIGNNTASYAPATGQYATIQWIDVNTTSPSTSFCYLYPPGDSWVNNGPGQSAWTIGGSQIFCKDPTSTSYIYMSFANSSNVYRINLDGVCQGGAGNQLQSYLEQTKWKARAASPGTSTGLLYIQSTDKMFRVNSQALFYTYAQTSYNLGEEIIPIPDSLVASYSQ